MAKLPESSKSARNLQAFELMNLAANAESDLDFSARAKRLGFNYLPDYSHGSLDKPRFCCTTVQEIDNPKNIYIMNRGLSWRTLNFSGFLEELPDIIAAARSRKPEDSGVLEKKLFDVRRDKDVEEITLVGHSRGGLVVDYNADNEFLISDEYMSARVISIESPGSSSWFKVRNPDYVEYISNFSGMVNACGTSSSKNPIAITNRKKITKGKDFLYHSFESHGIDTMLANFRFQVSLESRITCFNEAYGNFVKLGGKSSICSTLAVKMGDAIKNMSFFTSVFCSLMIDAVRPDSYAPPPEPLFSDFEEEAITLAGCLLGEFLL